MMVEFYRRNKGKILFAAALLSAAFSALCLVSEGFGLLQWVVFVPGFAGLFEMLKGEIKIKRAYFLALSFFFVYYAVLFHWFFYMFPLDFLGLSRLESLAVVLLGCFGISLLYAAFSALSVSLTVLLSRGKHVKRNRWLLAVFLACMWVLFEWGFTLTWAGVPWSRLAIGQINLPTVQSASVFGSYFITFIIVLVNGLIAYAVTYKKRIAVFTAMLVFSLNMIFGTLLMNLPLDSEGTVRVSAVQGNISSKDKWNEELFDETFEIYTRYALEAADIGAEIVLLPESVLPYVVEEGDAISQYMKNLAKKKGIYLLVGAFSSGDGVREGNSVFLYEPEGDLNPNVYTKRRLVPFGEYLPMGEFVGKLVPPLADMNSLNNDLVKGEGAKVMDTDIGKIGALICFDSIYETLAIESVREGAEIIVLSTNDSWFSDSAALKMHNNQARLRAIEMRRSIVRSANTGISSIITPYGQILDSIGANEKGIIVCDVPLNSGETLYVRLGNSFVCLCGGVSILLLCLSICELKKRRS